jgi:Sulfatase-modifying factor enzyme 1
MLLLQAELAAREWSEDGYHPRYVWQADRHKRLQGIIAKLGDQCTVPVVREFSSPQDGLVAALGNDTLTHRDRQRIGELLTELGDPRPSVGLRDGIPDIDWVEIPGGSVEIEGIKGSVKVKPFSIARYLVTHSQFQAFIDAEDGYRNKEWWKGFEQIEAPGAAQWQEPNGPEGDCVVV